VLIGLIWLTIHVVGCCENDNEPLGSIEFGGGTIGFSGNITLHEVCFLIN